MPIYVAQSHLHTNYIQKPESKPVIVPATTFAENFMEPNPDEVRFHCSLTSILTQNLAEKLTERRSNEDRLLYGHRERSSNPISVCSFGDPSSVPERGHYCCAEDYSAM